MSKYIVPEPELQVNFFHRLQGIRNIYLLDSLLETIGRLQIAEVDQDLAKYVSNDSLQKMAAWGLRGEIIFPVPCVLHANPLLLGYYRLLLGFSQKQFYGKQYGLSSFKLSMEVRGVLSTSNAEKLHDLCCTLCSSSEYLINGIGKVTQQDVHELTLLTLGPQWRGGVQNALGAEATRKVFDLISLMVEHAVLSSDKKSLEIKNAAGRDVIIAFSADPDIFIRERLSSGKYRNLVAIEIKGGKDFSNIHNRIGEAEKSHQKAKNSGYVEFWTLVGVASLDKKTAHLESPTTDRFYLIDKILSHDSEEAIDFRENLLSLVGVVD